ncbi:hypothetical protein GB931_06305 [Modestobacter sp. I12A-02628]|uniref:Uncharacterized protein n=1 Tax=Goekera deserti TaxID=2497753 RepID=A0A7K3WBA2_9ACTN|nr:hypothetical protein [Goekera deserti]MPQ97537.1 hypothetical protein [Goekera deserti]NDI47859.1 hypothetical protein [Goekera deserti]NEL53607.1 hypothetical protein [Goekera deserti]
MTTAFRYRTAHAVMMVGSVSAPGGLTPRRIGPAHATITRVTNGGGKKSLCGAYVAEDDDTTWPPEFEDPNGICHECELLADL